MTYEIWFQYKKKKLDKPVVVTFCPKFLDTRGKKSTPSAPFRLFPNEDLAGAVLSLGVGFTISENHFANMAILGVAPNFQRTCWFILQGHLNVVAQLLDLGIGYLQPPGFKTVYPLIFSTINRGRLG